jgi:NADH-quinone oxidoreductase subunit H
MQLPPLTLSATVARELGFGADPGPAGSLGGGALAAAVVAVVLLTNAAIAGPWAKRRVMTGF